MLVNVCHNKCRGIFFLVLTSEGVILPLFIFLYLISLFLPPKINSKNLEFTFFTAQELQPKGAAKAKQGREQRCSKILLIWGSLNTISAAVPARDCPCSGCGIWSGPDLTSARPLVQWPGPWSFGTVGGLVMLALQRVGRNKTVMGSNVPRHLLWESWAPRGWINLTRLLFHSFFNCSTQACFQSIMLCF